MRKILRGKIKKVSCTVTIIAGLTLGISGVNETFSQPTTHKNSDKTLISTKGATTGATSNNKASKFSPKAVALIEKVTHNQVVIESSFQAINGLEGYVVYPKQGPKQRLIIIVQKDGKFAFLGNIINSDGTNVTQEYNQKFIVAKQAMKAYKNLNTVSYITQGSDKAEHKAYVMIDPNCIFCHQLFLDMAPYIKENKLQIRWVPVGIMRPDSLGKAAHLLSTKTNEQAVKLLKEDEAKFNTKTKEGGLSVLDQTSSDPVIANAFKKVSKNNAYFGSHGFQGTPVIVFVGKKGKPDLFSGYPRGPQLKELMDKMSNKF